MARVMIHSKHTLYHFWEEGMNTTSHIQNRVTIWPSTKVTQYDL